MSKIICDVCGTSYPETANQCPICGCVRSSDSVTVAGDTSDVAAKQPSTYTYVKGGRFSKANVKKRNAGKPIYNAEPVQKMQSRSAVQKTEEVVEAEKISATSHTNSVPVDGNGKKNEIILVVAIVALLLAIAGVVIYIACSYLMMDTETKVEPTQTQQQTQTDGTDPTVDTVECTALKFAAPQIELTTLNEVYLLSVSAEPAGQDFELTFESDNPSVATVDAAGKVVAVGNGTANITVKCGNANASCVVVCDIPQETEPTEPTEPVVTYTEDDLKFIDNGWGYDYTHTLSEGSVSPYVGNIPAELVTFRSSNESVATVAEDGTVTFVKAGYVEIFAKYEEWEIKCVIRIG